MPFKKVKKAASGTVLLAEAFSTGWGPNGGAYNVIRTDKSEWTGNFTTFHGRSGNITFLDGHAASYSVGQAVSSKITIPYYSTDGKLYENEMPGGYRMRGGFHKNQLQWVTNDN